MFRWIALGVTLGVLSAGTAYAQQPAAQAATNTRVFASDAGLVLNFIKPDKTADFEAVIAKLKEAMQKSSKPERKQQAAGWKVFRSPDMAGANVLYVFVIDPNVKGADYSVANLIAEGFPPDQVSAIYTQYAGAYAQGQNIINLTLLSDLGK